MCKRSCRQRKAMHLPWEVFLPLHYSGSDERCWRHDLAAKQCHVYISNKYFSDSPAVEMSGGVPLLSEEASHSN